MLYYKLKFLLGQEGFEPPMPEATDLQSAEQPVARLTHFKKSRLEGIWTLRMMILSHPRLPIAPRTVFKILMLTPTFDLYSFDALVRLIFVSACLKVQQSSKRNLSRGYPERNYPYSTPQKQCTGFEPVLSVWRTDVLAANTNTACKSRSRENRTLTLFRSCFWDSCVFQLRHRPKHYRE